ncbi:MAG: hypothetical protein K2N60_07940, partial [Oscillospiraceae bacterium]|nr:hypothetical protein [Oscillospiraceae bacterium]
KNREFSQNLPDKNISVSQLVNNYALCNCALRALWNGIYLRNVICENNIFFDENVRFGMEDYLFNLKVLEYIDTVCFISNILYIHYDRIEQSTSAKYAPQKYADIINTAKMERLFLEKRTSIKETWIYHQYQYLSFYLGILTHPNNPININQKKDILKKINEPDQLGLQCSRILCFNFFFRDPKKGVISILYNFKAYRILLLLHEKYRMMTRYVKK